MAFECPACGDPKLEISSSLELPPQGDDAWGTLQNPSVPGTAFTCVALYWESGGP